MIDMTRNVPNFLREYLCTTFMCSIYILIELIDELNWIELNWKSDRITEGEGNFLHD